MHMNEPGVPTANPEIFTLSFRELLDYTAVETEHWRRWLAAHPEVLDYAAGAGRTGTVRGLVQHIFAVERRYADRLLGEPVTPYDAIVAESVDTLFTAGQDARARLERYLQHARESGAGHALGQRLAFQTLSAGTQSASARKIVVHTLIHGIRHWAQLASLVREQGQPTDWMHDVLFSDVLT